MARVPHYTGDRGITGPAPKPGEVYTYKDRKRDPHYVVEEIPQEGGQAIRYAEKYETIEEAQAAAEEILARKKP